MRTRRITAVLVAALTAALLLAPSALAADGVGLYGRTDDKVVTYFAFGLMVFFTVIVIVFSADPGPARQPQGAGARRARAPAPALNKPRHVLRSRSNI